MEGTLEPDTTVERLAWLSDERNRIELARRIGDYHPKCRGFRCYKDGQWRIKFISGPGHKRYGRAPGFYWCTEHLPDKYHDVAKAVYHKKQLSARIKVPEDGGSCLIA